MQITKEFLILVVIMFLGQFLAELIFNGQYAYYIGFLLGAITVLLLDYLERSNFNDRSV